ncbi:hypothetical protein ACIOUE_00935 [Streptomyces xanthochromogenes]|uniref:hypothetical protein n=1 Tax=Streptomyces xanthochromogenes TaxID=67384 RepID=UPI00380DC8A0
MPINDRDDVNHREAARILGTSLLAGLRRGYLTEAEERRIDRTIERAEIREAEKRAIRQAAQEARDRARFEAKKQKAVDRATKRSGFSWL